MPYETRRGEKRTTISVRMPDDELAMLDELARTWAIEDARRWAERMGREVHQGELIDAERKGLPRGEVLRRALVHAHRREVLSEHAREGR